MTLSLCMKVLISCKQVYSEAALSYEIKHSKQSEKGKIHYPSLFTMEKGNKWLLENSDKNVETS